MNKSAKITIIFTLLVIILLALQIYIETRNIIEYNTRVEAGDDRWHQVENRINEYEHNIQILELEIENIKLKQGGN